MPKRSPQFICRLSAACLLLLSMAACTAPEAKAPDTTATSGKTSEPAASTQGSKIDINSAPIAELDKLELPGTKPSLSERIQGGRPYKTTEDMVSKKVISADEYKLIQGLVTAGKSN